MRQLLVSTGAAVSYTANVLAAGAIDILKKSADGHTSLLPGDVITDSDEIQIIQGTGGKHIYSPWFKGNEVIKWRGQSYSAQVAQSTTMTFATAAVAAGEMSIKLTSVGQGQEQFKRKNSIISVTAGQAATGVGGIGQAMLAALVGLPVSSLAITTNYAIPGFPAVAQIDAAWAVITVTGNTFSITANTELGSWSTASEGFGTNGTTLAVAVVTSPTLGYGDAQVLGQYEKSLQGDKSFYNRIAQPNTPDVYIVPATTYDIYTLYIGNPVVGQIKGVDNFRTISIAYPVNGTGQAALESQLNPYLASTSGAFAPVNL